MSSILAAEREAQKPWRHGLRMRRTRQEAARRDEMLLRVTDIGTAAAAKDMDESHSGSARFGAAASSSTSTLLMRMQVLVLMLLASNADIDA